MGSCCASEVYQGQMCPTVVDIASYNSKLLKGLQIHFCQSNQKGSAFLLYILQNCFTKYIKSFIQHLKNLDNFQQNEIFSSLNFQSGFNLNRETKRIENFHCSLKSEYKKLKEYDQPISDKSLLLTLPQESICQSQTKKFLKNFERKYLKFLEDNSILPKLIMKYTENWGLDDQEHQLIRKLYYKAKFLPDLNQVLSMIKSKTFKFKKMRRRIYKNLSTQRRTVKLSKGVQNVLDELSPDYIVELEKNTSQRGREQQRRRENFKEENKGRKKTTSKSEKRLIRTRRIQSHIQNKNDAF